MQSKLFPFVLEHIQNKYLITDEEIFTECMFVRRSGPRFFRCKMYLKRFPSDPFCEWEELVATEEGEALIEIPIDDTEKEKIMEGVELQISKSVFALFLSCAKIQKKIEENLKTIRELKEDIIEVEYCPGGRGALEAQKHFEELASSL
nr:hypothetical protein MarFTME_304 [Marseillevirus futianmevirus]